MGAVDAPGREFIKKGREEIVAALQVADGAVGADARPWFRLHSEHVDGEVLMDGHTLRLGPVEIGLKHELTSLVPQTWRTRRLFGHRFLQVRFESAVIR